MRERHNTGGKGERERDTIQVERLRERYRYDTGGNGERDDTGGKGVTET